MILVTGGGRSGKSAFAENLAEKRGQKVLYIATAVPFDDEMRQRIQKHRQRRPAGWETLEGYINLSDAIEKKASSFDCMLLDCVTILITNLIFHFSHTDNVSDMNFEELEEKILEEIGRIADACEKTGKEMIFVTNEVGLGIVPENKLSRHFRDIAGKANQLLARRSKDVYFVVSGIPIKIKGEK